MECPSVTASFFGALVNLIGQPMRFCLEIKEGLFTFSQDVFANNLDT